jgi:hypothetical protein
MFGSLIRWFGHGAGCERSRRGAAIAPRFTPQLESLEGRAVPGGAGPPIHGEEIPQVCVRQETASPYQPGYEVALTDGAAHQVDLMNQGHGSGVELGTGVDLMNRANGSGVELGTGADLMSRAGGAGVEV